MLGDFYQNEFACFKIKPIMIKLSIPIEVQFYIVYVKAFFHCSKTFKTEISLLVSVYDLKHFSY